VFCSSAKKRHCHIDPAIFFGLSIPLALFFGCGGHAAGNFVVRHH
jgi:hypothetical protein